MRYTILPTGVMLITSGLALGQAPAGRPTFDVASVRAVQGGPSLDDFLRKNVQSSPDSVIIRRATLRTCIAWAYKVMDYQVSGPEWLDQVRFDIVAKSAEPTTEARLRLMAQSMLAERFKVEVHHETKDLPAMVLSVAKTGPKFKESESDGETALSPDEKRMTIAVQRGTMAQLTNMLWQFFHKPIVDQTGLTGKYDMAVNVAKYMADFQPSPGGIPPDPLAMVTIGLQEILGLKLDSKKVALDLVVVDHAEKIPVEN